MRCPHIGVGKPHVIPVTEFLGHGGRMLYLLSECPLAKELVLLLVVPLASNRITVPSRIRPPHVCDVTDLNPWGIRVGIGSFPYPHFDDSVGASDCRFHSEMKFELIPLLP